jgi:hypothetical protein
MDSGVSDERSDVNKNGIDARKQLKDHKADCNEKAVSRRQKEIVLSWTTVATRGRSR